MIRGYNHKLSVAVMIGALLAVGLCVAPHPPESGAKSATSLQLDECLNEFKHKRDDVNPARRQHIKEICGKLCSDTKCPQDDGGNKSDERLDSLDGDIKRLVEIARHLELACESIVWLMLFRDQEYTRKNEVNLLQEIKLTQMTKKEPGAVKRNVYKNYCKLLTYRKPNELIKHLHVPFNNNEWAVRHYERLLSEHSALKQCLDDFQRASSNMAETKYRLLEEFARSVRRARPDVEASLVPHSIAHIGLASPGSPKVKKLGELRSDAKAIVSVLVKRYGKNNQAEAAEINVSSLVDNKLVPACKLFVDTFEQLFGGDHYRENVDNIAKKMMEHKARDDVKKFILGGHIYLYCYLLTHNSREKLMEMINEMKQ